MIEHSHHDMGGRPGGKVEAAEHDYADWERRIDAMAVLLWAIKGGQRRLTVDEHRKAIESLPPELYDTLSYYEKWVYALGLCLIQRGVITSEELGKKLQDVSFQRQNHDMGGQPAARVARTEHDYEAWERRVDAMSVILGSEKKITVDERRRAIELLPPEAYDAMGYYERWTAALAETLVRRGMLTTEELGRKMMEVRDRG
jgi:hypothetical protein